MLFLAVLIAAGAIYGLVKLGNPLRPPAPPMPDKVTLDNIEQALRHISATYGQHEHDEPHDEADGPPPALKPLPRRRGRPAKPKPVPLAKEPKPAAAPKPQAPRAGVLASALRIPATIKYAGGHHMGERRPIIILSVVGHHGADGIFIVESLRAVCTIAKGLRNFKVSLIYELIDPATGEVVRDIPAWLDTKLAGLV